MKKATDRRKVLAVLAGGVVLGVGAAVTLAAWNDSEFATGTFTAGQFNLEGSIDGTDYDEHDSAGDAAEIVFTAGFDALAPGQVVYAPFWVRLDASTTVDATLTPAGVTTDDGDNDEHLSYAVYPLAAGATCGAAAVDGVDDLVSGATLDASTPGDADVQLAFGAAGTPGTAVQLCFEVTAGADLVEDTAATATWQFTATSN